ncbi:non-ribosomal peptide synthetase [Streptomyces albus]|uniref:non-ribosomal peptide synthetase n=1 Tax=Streptomyces sp. HPH0547 TaxID=1203592 RepID=UPI00039D9D25|nr:non-ribosomal peptide synthetase [Streptomyces sp. HPH0547]
MGQIGSGEGLPLTAAQTGMWIAQQLDPDSPCFRAAEAVEIRGAVDAGLLERALRHAVEETEALRVRFGEGPVGEEGEEGQGGQGGQEEEQVRQYVEKCDDWPLPLIDLRGESAPDAAAHAWMWADLGQPVDPRRSRVFSFAVLRTAHDRYLLYLAIHHIAMDGYAMSLFLPRVAQLYTALESGAPLPERTLAPLARALEDEAAYHRSERMVRDRAYWTEQLAAWGGSAPQPSGHWLRPARTFVRETGHLEPEAAQGLRALAREERTGLATAAMAALALYVHRLGGAEPAADGTGRDGGDGGEGVVLDVTVTGRGGATRDVPCMLANVLPLRVPCPAAGTVGELLRRTTEQAKGLLRHQRYPFWHLMREAGTARRLAGGMADWGINVMTHDPKISFGRHPALLHNLSNGPVTGMSVNVYDRPDDGSLRIDFQADPAVHPPEQVAAHHRRFLELLRTLATAGTGSRLDTLDVATRGEREQVLAWGRGPHLAVPAKPLHTAFEERVREDPDAVALVCGPSRAATVLGRRALNARANRLAHLLLDRGAGPGTTVALALPRTEAYAAALLAVLKTGAACLPLEAGHPAERTRMMLADAAPLCVLATRSTAPGLPGDAPVLLTDSDSTIRALARRPASDPRPGDLPRPPRPDDAAYLAFTSGTTGRPKGVVVEHRQLSNLHHDHLATLIGPAAQRAGGRRLRAALTASFTFDTSWEAWLFLAAGHEVHLIEDGVRHDATALTARVEDQRLDFLDLTPSLLRHLLDAGLFRPGAHHPGTLMVGGEALDPALWRRLRALPATTVLNYYGPTECTVDAVWCRLDEQGEHPVIGRPQHNVRAYVLDRGGRLCPPGVRGELYLGGAQVARGYLGAPAATAARFLPDPFAAEPDARMYRTGDLVRWTDDGALEYLGRTDGQIKLRGVRIEPAEIETVLAAHPGVAQVAVAAHGGDGTAGAPHLAAHFVPAPRRPRDGTRPSPAAATDGPDQQELRSWAAARLPAAMVPAVYIAHDALPLTPQGKLDRAALPSRTPARPPAQRRAPRTAHERTVCALFAEVLGVPEAGPDDDFFALGGHSLTATRLLTRLRAALGADVSLGALYQAATPARLAALLDTSAPAGDRPAADGAWRMLLPLRPDGTDRPLFCVHPSGGLGWCYATLPPHLPPHVPVYALQAQGLHPADRPATTFPGLIAEYAARLRTVQEHGPYRLLGWSLGGALAHAVAARLQADGEEVELLALLDAAPIDPAHRPGLHTADPAVVERLVREALGSHAADAAHVGAVTRVLERYEALLPTYRHSLYKGPAHYFRATVPDPAHRAAGGPQEWEPYLTAPPTVHDIPCTHSTMGTAPAMARIGRLLHPLLAREHQHQ